MSINFQTFLEKTGYTAPYAARTILYSPRSRPALLAETLDLDIEGERSKMIQVVAGNEIDITEVKTISKPPKRKTESPQLEIMDSSPVPATDANTAGEAA